MLQAIRQLEERFLHAIGDLTKEIKHMADTQAQLATKLGKLSDQLTKIGKETTSLLTMIDDLKAQIAAGPVTPELQAAFDKVEQQAGIVDALVPDPPA